MIGLAIVGDLELGCLLVQNDATNGIYKHYFNLIEVCVVLIITIDKKKKVRKMNRRF